MKINQLEIKDRATLANVKADFADVNVIYGRNGTGKTLISEVFRAAENGVDIDLGTASFRLNGGSRVSSSDFRKRGLTHRIRVFNRRFVNENVFGEDPKAIVLGHQVKKGLDRANAIQKEINKLESVRSGLLEQASSERKSVDDLMIGVGQEVRRALGPVAHLDGSPRRWANYNKSDVDRVANEIRENVENFRKDENQLYLISNAIAEHSFQAVKEVAIRPPDPRRWFEETKKLCSIKFETSLLDELSQDARLASWLEIGLDMMQASNHCPFCKQEVPANRVDRLRSHYTKQQRELNKQVDDLMKEISSWLNDIHAPEVSAPDGVRANLREDYKETFDELQRMLARHRELARYLLDLLQRKSADLSTVLRVDDSSAEWNEDTITQINSLVRIHNDRDAGIKLGEECERAMVAAIMPRLIQGEREIEKLKKDVVSKEREVNEKKHDLNVTLMASRPEARAAERLNEMLGDFIGHGELSFELNMDGSTLRLARRGSEPTGLSEGERNALGLMYFLMQLEDRNFVAAESVVVFDDPITSFDDQRLFDAVSKILYRTGIVGKSQPRVGQFFLLTHHLGLLDRLWREFNRSVKGVKYFEMRSEHDSINGDRRTSLMKVKTPTRFRYHIAFGDVYDIAYSTVSVANPGISIRLCIEGFLFSMTPIEFNDGMALERKLDRVYRRGEPERIRRGDRERITAEEIHALCLAANAGSHDDLPDRPVNVDDERTRFRIAAKKLLQLIGQVSPMHYEDMERVVKRRNNTSE